MPIAMPSPLSLTQESSPSLSSPSLSSSPSLESSPSPSSSTPQSSRRPPPSPGGGGGTVHHRKNKPSSTASPVRRRKSTAGGGATSSFYTLPLVNFLRRRLCSLPPIRFPRRKYTSLTSLFVNLAFKCADVAMYILGPVLIALASSIILGLTYAYFWVLLPMIAGTNHVATEGMLDRFRRTGGTEELDLYWEELRNGALSPDDYAGLEELPFLRRTALALSVPSAVIHTAWVAFVLVNVVYNYARCVATPNGRGPSYDRVVREIAAATGFAYPETEEGVADCKKDFERRMLGRIQAKRRELTNDAAAEATNAAADDSGGPTSTHSAGNTNGGAAAGAADEESQRSSPESINGGTTAPRNNRLPRPPKPQPKVYGWMLLQPDEWSFCRHTRQPKPPRSHYDHVTKTLVMNMDHYCPWMFNAVGYFNYRYFVNFLLYVSVGLIYGAAVMYRPFTRMNGLPYRNQIKVSRGVASLVAKNARSSPGLNMGSLSDGRRFVYHLRDDPYVPTPDEKIVVAFAFMMCVAVGAAVACLLGFHAYLLLTAQTTIEFHGNFANRRRAKTRGGVWKNPYDVGRWDNFRAVYGDDGRSRPFAALLPSSREPEFLPVPIDGALVLGRKRGGAAGHDKKVDPDDGPTPLSLGTDVGVVAGGRNASSRGLTGRAGRTHVLREEDNMV